MIFMVFLLMCLWVVGVLVKKKGKIIKEVIASTPNPMQVGNWAYFPFSSSDSSSQKPTTRYSNF